MTGPRTLVVMRHAKSSWKTSESDLRRPLSGRGTRDAVVAGQELAGLVPDLVLLSPATRVQQTWQCLQLGGVSCGDVRTVESLYFAGTLAVLEVLREVAPEVRRVLLIAHEPTVSDLVLSVTGPSPHRPAVTDKFPTSGVAVITFEGDWQQLGTRPAELATFQVPRG